MAPLILDDKFERALKDLGVPYAHLKETPQTPVTATNSDDAWTIDSVNYRGKIIPVVLSRELLPDMNLDQMVAHAKRAIKKGEPYSADAQLVYAVAKRAKEQGNEEVRKFMKDAIFSQYPNTLSVVRYNPAGKLDEIVHNPKLPNRFSTKVDFVSPDENVKGSARTNDYKALLGTSNPDEVDDVFGWVTGKRAYMVKINSKPSSTTERVVKLVASSIRFCLGCYYGVPQVAGASFGVCLPQKI